MNKTWLTKNNREITAKMNATANRKTTRKYPTACQGHPCYQLPLHEKKSPLLFRTISEVYALRKGLTVAQIMRPQSSNKQPYEVQIVQSDF